MAKHLRSGKIQIMLNIVREKEAVEFTNTPHKPLSIDSFTSANVHSPTYIASVMPNDAQIEWQDLILDLEGIKQVGGVPKNYQKTYANMQLLEENNRNITLRNTYNALHQILFGDIETPKYFPQEIKTGYL